MGSWTTLLIKEPAMGPCQNARTFLLGFHKWFILVWHGFFLSLNDIFTCNQTAEGEEVQCSFWRSESDFKTVFINYKHFSKSTSWKDKMLHLGNRKMQKYLTGKYGMAALLQRRARSCYWSIKWVWFRNMNLSQNKWDLALAYINGQCHMEDKRRHYFMLQLKV